ncbi:hypothetical protein LPLAFNJD_LOCUS1977 [Methylorubrum aminovorans]
MSTQKHASILLRDATTLDFIADELSRAAAVQATENNPYDARTLMRMAREQRVKAILSRARAAAAGGEELLEPGD